MNRECEGSAFASALSGFPPPGRAFSFGDIEKPRSSEDEQGMFQAASFHPMQ